MKLIDFMAKSCYYAQEHIDDLDAWDKHERDTNLTCVSYQMACFLAQNTREGREGVDCNIILEELIEHPLKEEKEWKKILNEIADDFGGWKKIRKKQIYTKRCEKKK